MKRQRVRKTIILVSFFLFPITIYCFSPALIIILYFFTGLIFILALAAGRRAFCHYVCWMAPFMIIVTKIRNLFKWPALQLRANRDRCTNCLNCTGTCVMSLDVNGMVQKGSMVNSECILCGSCADACPEGVIRYAFRKGM